MNGFNQVTIAGNLTRDPELRYTPKGTAVADFGLAINKSWKDEQGEKHEKCTFVDVTAWSGAAETISQYLHKGDPILLSGELDLQTWEDKQTGDKRSKLKVILRSFTFMPSGKGGDRASAPAAPQPRRAAQTPAAAPASDAAPAAGEEPPTDSEIPF